MAQTVHSTITWTEGLVFDGKADSGHPVRLDSERRAGASPMELMLMAMGACSSVDVVMVLQQPSGTRIDQYVERLIGFL